MNVRVEIDIDEDDDSFEDKSPFELRSGIAEVRREMIKTLVDSGRWTVLRGQSGIYFLERDKETSEEASIGFKREQ